jgi:isoquinoline 1-oxidoreductase beta subunit
LNLDRRTLLIGGGAGVGLVVVYLLAPSHLKSPFTLASGEQGFGAFIKIARDGRITVAVPQIETGQGIWTALPQIVADELGADWETVAVEPAPLTAAYANPLASHEGWLDDIGRLRAHGISSDGRTRITAGATSVRAFAQPMREAAAVARAMLAGAAADRWGISVSECDAADGMILNGTRTFTFGELAEEAAERTPPSDPPLRQTTAGRLIGQPLQRLDAPAKTNGSLRFAGDVRLPGMLFASLRVAPPGGHLTGFSKKRIAQMPGVRHVAARRQWVAAVADTWAQAEAAIKAAGATFSGTETPQDLRPLFEDVLHSGGSRKRFRRGHYASAVEGSRPLTATYYVAPSEHLGLEPLTATARFGDDGLEVWTATQAPGLARHRAAEAGRLRASSAALYPMPVGAPSGRAIEADAIPYAVELARVVKAPVQAVFSQSVSQNHASVSPGALARMTALPGAGGITAAWKMEIVTINGMASSIGRMLNTEETPSAERTAVDGIPPYGIPNVTIEAIPVELPFRAGYMRGSPEREMMFATESFIDELAHAAGLEPLGLRMALLGENGRLARCLQGASRRAQWDGGGAGSTMGIAGCSAFGSHIALVANASIDEGQRVKVHKLVAAVDCGRAVNPGLIAQQVESSLIWAIAQATLRPPEWVAGMPRAEPFRTRGLPRLGDIPEIDVEVIPSSEEPGGVNGLGVPVLAPAVANAIFAGTGRRLRTLPFDLSSAA